MQPHQKTSTKLQSGFLVWPLSRHCNYTGLHTIIAHHLTPACVVAGLERVHLRIPMAASRITIVEEQMPCLKDMSCALQRFANAHVTLHLHGSAVLPLPSQIELFMQDHIGWPAQRHWAARRAAHSKAVDVTQYGTQLHHSRGAVADKCRHARGSCTAQRAAPPGCGQLPLRANRWCAAICIKYLNLVILQIIRDQMHGLFHDKHHYIKSYATCVPAVLHAGRTACTQLSTLRKLASLTAGQRPTQHLQAVLPALRVLKRLRCHVPSLHADSSGALPALNELKALTELHITSKVAGDYRLAFPPSLQVHEHTCFCMLVACTCCECTPACRVQLERTRTCLGFLVTAA